MDTCVCCGAVLPYEGTWICWRCEKKLKESIDKEMGLWYNLSTVEKPLKEQEDCK